MAYDALNRLSAVRDVWNVVLSYTYDLASRVSQVADSFGGIVSSIYNSVDQLQTRELSTTIGNTRYDFRATLAYDAAYELTTVAYERNTNAGGTSPVW